MAQTCPFQPKRGYVDARAEYLFHFHDIVDDDDNDSDVNVYENVPTKSLRADTDTNKRLYFWQLYSLIGDEPIREIVSDFYDRVYADDENPWFRDAFVRLAPKNHHIHAQFCYWLDAFGGGRVYHGGDYRVKFHHSVNAGKVMTARGAKVWIHHMRKVLLDANKKSIFVDDPRIMASIVEFLETKMRTYALDNGWAFDTGDFDALKRTLTPSNGTERIRSD